MAKSGIQTRPQFKSDCALVNKHPETVNGPRAVLSGFIQKWSHRSMDNIAHDHL